MASFERQIEFFNIQKVNVLYIHYSVVDDIYIHLTGDDLKR